MKSRTVWEWIDGTENPRLTTNRRDRGRGRRRIAARDDDGGGGGGGDTGGWDGVRGLGLVHVGSSWMSTREDGFRGAKRVVVEDW